MLQHRETGLVAGRAVELIETVVVAAARQVKGKPGADHAALKAIGTCFYNLDCDHIMQSHVRFWCFGHTHYNSDHTATNSPGKCTRIVSNQLGYFMKGNRTGFQGCAAYEV